MEMSKRSFVSGLSGNKGTYHVRENELQEAKIRHENTRNFVNSNLKKPLKTISCLVHFLDSTSHSFEIDKRSKGSILLDAVFQHLELIERDYFGLQFTECPNHYNHFTSNTYSTLSSQTSANSITNCNESLRWLDASKLIRKQYKGDTPFTFYFSVKFYVSDPSKLQEEYTRYHFFLQIRKNILDGKLVLPPSSAVLLASYAVQSELGDYCSDEHKPGYISEMKLLPNQNEDLENSICELHKLHKGQTPADAEFNFLDHVKRLDMYGVDLYRAKDSSNVDIQIGVSSAGLIIFQNSNKINTFSWAKIIKISFKRKQFFVQLRREGAEEFDNMIGFYLLSYRACKNLWKSCVEHHTFFRLQIPKPQTKRFFFFFTLGSKFRYSGKTEFQTLEESRRRARAVKTFVRSSSRRYARQTVPNLSTNQSISKGQMLTSSSNIVTKSSSSRQHSNKMLNGIVSCSSIDSGPNLMPLAITANLSTKSLNHHNTVNTTSSSSPASRAQTEIIINNSSTTVITHHHHYHHCRSPFDNREYNKVNSSEANNCIERKVWDEDGIRSQDLIDSLEDATSYRPAALSYKNLPFIDSSCSSTSSNASSKEPSIEKQIKHLSSPALTTSSITTIAASTGTIVAATPALTTPDTDRSESGNEAVIVGAKSKSPINGHHHNGNVKNLRLSIFNDESPTQGQPAIITIRMKPDDQGRFGFNVKGGADQNLPVLVSRVAPNTPADNCIPKLNEGDQVITVNNVELNGLDHDEVVDLIRSTKEKAPGGELVLTIRPNVYTRSMSIGNCLNDDDEPPFMYIPVDASPSTRKRPKSDRLHESMMLMNEGLETGALIAQFEQLDRKKFGEQMDIAKLAENLFKNRYRDISPYDSTRVILNCDINGDYINASHVNMEIPTTGIVNRYIATQGPLSHTCDDFWLMVWEQQSSLIVMVTTLVERGRVKCHKYWPDLDDYEDFEYDLRVKCTEEVETLAFIERRLTIINKKNQEERQIIHLQYLAWPDHGVPEDAQNFLELILKVRHFRLGTVEPVIVHCSAGIGRTGVLILMETAMCLIEANEPVYAIEIVKTMRDQRAMLIQTSSQFRFVLEAILKVYNEKIVAPLNEYIHR